MYDSIDNMPIYNWFKVNETNDLRWISKVPDANISWHRKKLSASWEKIFSEFIDTFGIPEKLKEIMELRRDIFVLKGQLALTGDRTLQLFVDIENEKLEKLLSRERGSKSFQIKTYVEKFLGFKLNEKETTVREFYNYVNALNDQSEKSDGRE